LYNIKQNTTTDKENRTMEEIKEKAVNFELGRTVATQGAVAEIEAIASVRAGIEPSVKPTMGQVIQATIQKQAIMQKLITDHKSLEKGALCDDDYQQNLEACKHEGIRDKEGNLMQSRIFSLYKVEEVEFYVITEWDRSVTTILLPSEY
jgi:hypothetical protein